MFTNAAVIAVIFRLCNFCLVIALAAYVFNKYILPMVREHMAKDEAEREFLLNQQKCLENKLSELRVLIQQDGVLHKQYMAKIDEWKRVVDQEDIFAEKEREARVVLVAEKEYKKTEWQKNMALQSLIVKRVIADLDVSLSHYFKNESVGKDYMEDIVRFMNERAL